MNETTVEETLQGSNEKETLLSDTVSGITDSFGVEDFGMSVQCNSNKENLIDSKITETVSDKGSCSFEQLDNSSCSFETSEQIGIIDKQDSERINSELESEESQNSEATEIFVPPKEFCDSNLHEANLISLDSTNNVILNDNIQDHNEINHLKKTKVESHLVDMPMAEESSSLLDCINETISDNVISDNNQLQEFNIETIEKNGASENLIVENLIDLGNPLNDSKDYVIREVIYQDKKTDKELIACGNNCEIDNKETLEKTNTFGKTSVNDAQVDLTPANENELHVSPQDETADHFDKDKHEEINISKCDDSNISSQIKNEICDSNENSHFEKINNDIEVSNNMEVKAITNNGEIFKSFADSTLNILTNENDSSEITISDHSAIPVQNQLISVNKISVDHKDSVNNEIPFESHNNFNTKEALSIELKDIDMMVVNNQDQNITSPELEMLKIENNNEFTCLLEVDSNQAQTLEKESLQDEIVVKSSEISEIASFEEVGDILEVETNSKNNQSSVTYESLSEIKNEMSKNIEKEISESSCALVTDNLGTSMEIVLQKREEKDLQNTDNILTSDNDSKLVLNESEEKASENTEIMFSSPEKLIEKIVTVDNINNSIMIDDSNKIDDTRSVEDKKPINKTETLKVDQKDTSRVNNAAIVSTQCLKTENKNLPASENKPEALITTLQCMKWLKSGQNHEVNQISNQLKSLPKKNERADVNLFEGTAKKNANKRRRSGHNRNEKLNTTSQLKSIEGKSLQNPQVSQLQSRTEQTKKETSPSVWNNNTAKQLFPNSNAVVIDRIKEEEDLTEALTESICTAQQEAERRKMLETKLKIHILDESDDDQWGKVHRNLPNDDKGINQNTAKGVFDKYGRVDGYSEKHVFMGKNARRREQEFLKSQTENISQVEVAHAKPLENKSQVVPSQEKLSENKSQVRPTQAKPTENKSQVRPTQAKPTENKSQVRPTLTKSSETNIAQTKPNCQSDPSNNNQNAEPSKMEVHQASKCQERPIHGRAGYEGPPGQAELQKPGFNRSANYQTNVKQGQNFPTPQNNANNVGQAYGKNQDYRNQQSFGEQRYRDPHTANKGTEEINKHKSCFSGQQDIKRQENFSKVQSFPDRNQGNTLKNQEQNNQKQNQLIKNQTDSDQTNKGQISELSKGRTYSDQMNKNAANYDSLNKNQIYVDRTATESSQKQNDLKQNQAHSNRNQGNSVQNRTNFNQTPNQAYCDRNQGIAAQNRPNPSQNQTYSDNTSSNPDPIRDNTRQHQTNLGTNQNNSGQKHVTFVNSQIYSDRNQSQMSQISASRDQDNFGRNPNYCDKNNGSTLRNQDDYRSRSSYRYQDNNRNQGGCRNEESCKSQDSYRNQETYKNRDDYNPQHKYKTHDNYRNQDNYNRVQTSSDRSYGNQNNYNRSHGNQNNADRNYSSRVQDSHLQYQNYSDNNKGNYQNQHCSDRNKENAFKNHENYRGNQSQDNQQKNLNSCGKNQCYSNKQQEDVKQVKEFQIKASTEEDWDDDANTIKCNQTVYNQLTIKNQDSKVDHQSSSLENKRVSMDKTIGVQQTTTPASISYRDVASSQVHLPSNLVLKTSEIKPELTNIKKANVEPRPNVVMAFDGNANIQRALGLDRTTNYNQLTASASTASVSTALTQLLNSSVSSSLPLTQTTSEISANYDAAMMSTGGMMNVNAPPFNATNLVAAPFSTDLETSFASPSLEVSETPNPTVSRISNSSEEIMQAHRDVTTISKQLATAQAKLLALNVKFYNEYISSMSAQNSTAIPNDGTVEDVQSQQSRLLHTIPDFVAMQHSIPQGFPVSTAGVQNVTPVPFDASGNFATVNMQEMANEAYQLNPAFQQRLSLQSMYVTPGAMYQTQTAANYQPQAQSTVNYQPQAIANYQPQAAANYQQYNSDVNATIRLQRGRGTSPNGEQKDLRVGGHQFYNQ